MVNLHTITHIRNVNKVPINNVPKISHNGERTLLLGLKNMRRKKTWSGRSGWTRKGRMPHTSWIQDTCNKEHRQIFIPVLRIRSRNYLFNKILPVTSLKSD